MSLRLQDELHWHLLSTKKRILSTLSVVFSYQEPMMNIHDTVQRAKHPFCY